MIRSHATYALIGQVIVKHHADTNGLDRQTISVASIGVRGGEGDAQAQVARMQLEYWLAEHKDQYRIAGEPRYLRHQQPLVSTNLCCAELQIPIQPCADLPGVSSADVVEQTSALTGTRLCSGTSSSGR
jgi:hypothetical protein